jgi:hypothetical protein
MESDMKMATRAIRSDLSPRSGRSGSVAVEALARSLRFTVGATALAMLVAGCGGGGGSTSPAPTSAATAPSQRDQVAAVAQVQQSVSAHLVLPRAAAFAAVGSATASDDFTGGMSAWQNWGNAQVVAGAGTSASNALRVGTAAGGAALTVPGVVAGTAYRLTANVRVSNLSDPGVLGVNFYDALGNQLVAYSSPQAIGTTYGAVTLDALAPANSAFALVWVWKNAGTGYIYVDDVVFGTASATPPPPPPPPAPPPAALPGNLVLNGGFESGFDNWVNWGNAGASSTQPAVGTSSARVGTAAGGFAQNVPGVVGGAKYRLNAQVKVSAPGETGLLGVKFTDGAGVSLQDMLVPFSSTVYSTLQLDLTAPANATGALLYVWKNDGSGFAYVDELALGAPPDYQVVPVAAWPHTLLQAGRATDAYWVEDGVWAAQDLTRGTYTGLDGTTFEQYTGVSPKVGPNGEIGARISWKWPTGHSEINSFPSIISGQKPGWFNTWTTPGGFDIQLPDGTTSQVFPSGRTPGSFFPLQLPIVSLKASADYRHLSPPTGRGHLAYDMFLQGSATQFNGFGKDVTQEIIVPLDYWGGYGQYPTRNPQWYDHDVTIDGILYHIYIYKDSTGFVLSTFGGGWKFIVFEPDRPIPPGTLDLAKIVNYVSTQKDAFGIPWATGHEYLVSLELGIEPQYGTGDIQVNNYRVWH